MTRYFLIILSCFFIVSCFNSSEGNAAFQQAGEPEFADQSIEEPSTLAMSKKTNLQLGESKNDQNNDQGNKPVVQTKKLIRNANVRMELDNYEEGKTRINKLIEEYNAIISNEAEKRYTYRIENRLTIRLNPTNFDPFIEELDKIALNIVNKSITTRDVTRQYVDLETRLAAKRAIVQRYREILQSARSIPDVLAVEENLRKVVEEIESTEGQLRYLKDQVQFSTITLDIFQEFDRPAVSKRGFFSRVGNALGDGWEILQELVIGLFTIWPIVLIIGLLVYLGIRRIRKKKA